LEVQFLILSKRVGIDQEVVLDTVKGTLESGREVSLSCVSERQVHVLGEKGERKRLDGGVQ
jgi:hypothetical protein